MKPLRCRLGFHSTFSNTFGTNIGSKETPIYVLTTEQRCNDCSFVDPPRLSPELKQE